MSFLNRPLWALFLAISMPIGLSAAEGVGPVSPGVAAEAEQPGTVSVDQLAELARRHHPLGIVVDADRRAAAADVAAARRWANPEIEFEVGQAQAREGDEEEGIGSISVRQPLEWPGKRSRRVAAASVAAEAIQADAAVALLSLEAEVRQAAVDVIIQRRAVEVARAGKASIADVLRVVERRVAAGESGQADLLRVKVEDARAAQAVTDSEREVEIAYLALDALCTKAIPRATSITIPEVALAADAADVQALADGHPRLRHLRALVRQQRAELARERYEAAPEFSVGAFAEREADTDNLGVALGIEVPLWDRNQAGVARAGAHIARAEAEVAIAAKEIAREAIAAWFRAKGASDRMRLYRDEIRPAAQEAQRLALLSYQGNEGGILDLLDARRTAQDVEEQALDAERGMHAATISLRQAIGSFTTSSTGTQP